MKNRAFFHLLAGLAALLSLAVPAGAVPPTREELTKVYNAGVAAFNKEDFATAERQFLAVLTHVPQHAPSRKYLIDIDRKRKAEANIPPMEKELSKIIVPEIKVEDATLEEYLSLVVLKVKEVTGGKTVLNFVFRPSTPAMTDKPVTLTMTAVPASELIRQAGQVTGTKFSYEKYAIVVTPARSSAVDAETTAALDAAAKGAGQ